jgi:NitT/TauT family transport system substrate-binding protein
LRIPRRSILQMFGGAALVSAFDSFTQVTQAQTATSMTIGYWPNAAGLPFFVALEQGIFKQVGLNVKAVRLSNPQQAIESIIANRIDGTPTGTPAINLILGEVASPNLFKMVAHNGSNSAHVLDQFIVPKDSPIKTIGELDGKKIAIPPTIQFDILGKAIAEKSGIQGAKLVQLNLPLHIPAIKSGQVDAAFTIEPIATVGRVKGITRTLETGVISKYVLGDPAALWFGGAAVISTKFIKANPQAAEKYVEAYRLAIASIQKNPKQARQHLAKYSEIDVAIAEQIPLPLYMLSSQLSATDIKYFQKFINLYSDKKVLASRIDVKSLMLT